MGTYSSPQVEDRIIARIRAGHLKPVVSFGPDPCHYRYEVTVFRLDHATMAELSDYGDAVAVSLDPYVGGRAGLPAARPPAGRAAESSGALTGFCRTG